MATPLDTTGDSGPQLQGAPGGAPVEPAVASPREPDFGPRDREANGEHAIPLLPTGSSRTRSPTARSAVNAVAVAFRSLHASLPVAVQNAIAAGVTFARRNTRLTILAAVFLVLLLSANYIREEVEDWYEDRYEHDDDDDRNPLKSLQGSGVAGVSSQSVAGTKPGQLIIHPDQEDAVRTLILQIMLRFNRMTYDCDHQVMLGGVKAFAGEGTWPVCFDAPYWRKNRLSDSYSRLDTSLDKLNEGAKGNCVQYTFGVDWDWSFDEQFHAKTGCDSHSFDPSMEMESAKRSDHHWYWNLGISSKDELIDGKGMRSGKVAKWTVKTLSSHMRSLKHRHISLLKIDVEGFEWAVLREALDSGVLEHVEQLLFEIHLWDGLGPFASKEARIEVLKQWYRILAELEDVWGFRLFYVHTNGMSTAVDWDLGYRIHCCYEVAYFKGKKKDDS
ncbi:hypothetical protein DFJ74DRAFT_317243 [Hyaloraphidium curvatum]|nr:hypothetical protein DFJ74DRAFT_317243 [Hyaloraphidium curvatum]